MVASFNTLPLIGHVEHGKKCQLAPTMYLQCIIFSLYDIYYVACLVANVFWSPNSMQAGSIHYSNINQPHRQTTLQAASMRGKI